MYIKVIFDDIKMLSVIMKEILTSIVTMVMLIKILTNYMVVFGSMVRMNLVYRIMFVTRGVIARIHLMTHYGYVK